MLFAVLGLLVLAMPSAVQASFADRDVTLLFQTMNAARIDNGLRPLQLDLRLCSVAYEHAADMARRHYFEHTTPEGITAFQRMRADHIRFGYAGENLAVDQSAQSIFWDFWESYEHRENMLGAHYARVGIAAIDAPVGTIVVEDFSD